MCVVCVYVMYVACVYMCVHVCVTCICTVGPVHILSLMSFLEPSASFLLSREAPDTHGPAVEPASEPARFLLSPPPSWITTPHPTFYVSSVGGARPHSYTASTSGTEPRPVPSSHRGAQAEQLQPLPGTWLALASTRGRPVSSWTCVWSLPCTIHWPSTHHLPDRFFQWKQELPRVT